MFYRLFIGLGLGFWRVIVIFYVGCGIRVER